MSPYIYNTRIPMHHHSGPGSQSTNLVITIRFVAPPARNMYAKTHTPASVQAPHMLWKVPTHKKVAMRLRLVNSHGSTKEIVYAKSLLA